MTDSVDKDRDDAAPDGTDARSPPTSPSRAQPLLDSVVPGFGFYYFTSLIVIVGVVFAVDFVPLHRAHPGSNTRVDLPSAFAAWDGEWYARIASAGYSYDPGRMSNVAFFPLYPWLAGAVVHATGMRPEWALLLVSHAALVATFALLAAYVQQRFQTAGPDLASWTLLAFGLFPTAFFFRMAYTESLFMLLAVLTLYGMERRWHIGWIALVVGLATASRSVGVALVVVMALHLWRTSATVRGAIGRCVVWLPLCCWGLAGYILFQGVAFGEPLAFWKTQGHWNERSLDLTERFIGLLTLEPIRAVYDPGSPCYWARVPPQANLLFNLKAANPVYFLITVALIGVGVWKRWLNANELLLAAGLLGIAYCLQASRACMSSQARYAAVVFPVYLVLGQLLQRAPPPLAAAVLAISGLLLAIYSAMFVSWYWFY
jgi:hypothetical protein